MEKLVFIPFIFLMLAVAPLTAAAVDWITANQFTVQWDHSGLEGGYILPAGDTIEFRIYLADSINDPDLQGPISDDWQTPNLEYTLTLLTEGKFYVGVQAVRLREGSIISNSRIAWSKNVADCADGQAFGVVYYLNPLLPFGLSVK